MTILRGIWFLLNLVVWFAYYGTVVTGAALLGIKNKPGGVYDWGPRGWSRRILTGAGVPVRVVGHDKVPDGQPVVFVSNHQSWFDIWALAGFLPGRVRFVAKRELMKVPFLGTSIAAGQHIYIDRANRARAFAAYENAAKVINAGMSAIVFVEGTRSRTGELQPFKKGPFVMAIAAGVPVVPVYCAGTFTILPKGKIMIRPHPIAVMVGDPISTEGLQYDDREGLMLRARAAVEQLRIDSLTELA